jgi:hypothetical protein
MGEIIKKFTLILNKYPKIIIFLPPLICFIAIIIIELFVIFPIAGKQQNLLESEIKKLEPPREAILLEKGTSNKFSQASVNESYYINWDAIEVFDYYFKGLIENGWDYKGQDNVAYQSVGQIYCKGKYTLHLNYYEDGYNWKYSIWIWWGNPSECDLVNYSLYADYLIFICYCISMGISLLIAIYYFANHLLRKGQ